MAHLLLLEQIANGKSTFTLRVPNPTADEQAAFDALVRRVLELHELGYLYARAPLGSTTRAGYRAIDVRHLRPRGLDVLRETGYRAEPKIPVRDH